MSATATKATTGKSTSGSARRKPRTASKSASPAKRSTKTSAARADSEPAAATPPTKGTKTAAKAAKAPSRSKGSAATASRKATTAAKSSARAKPEAAAATKASATNKNAAGASTKGKAVGKAKAATAKTAAKSTAPVKAARPTTESKATATDAVKPDGQARANVKKAATAQPAKAAAKPSPKPKRTAARKRVAPRPEGFKNGNWVVHPSHGPGRVVGSERLSVGGETLELVTIAYGREMARLKIPVTRIQELGLRPISSKAQIQAATNTLKKPARISRTMWSRRAQDYESKLHSGDLVQIAEVLRDLYRAPDGPEQSFSERELYKDALDRFSREIAAAETNLTEEKAAQRLESVLRRAT